MASFDEPKTEVQVFLGKDDLWYWRILAANNKIVGAAKSGEGTQDLVIEQFHRFAHHLGAHTPAHFYQDGENQDGEHRWTIEYDGDVIGKSSEGYNAVQSCEENLELLRELVGRGYEFHQVL